MLEAPVASGRDDDLAALIEDFVEEIVRVVGAIGQDGLGGQAIDDVAGGSHVVLLAWT
jgi:hypothetical protein